MGAAGDSSTDANRASGSVRPPLPNRVRLRFTSGIAPATPPQPPGALSSSDARVSPLIPVLASVRPLGHQPKLPDRLREAPCARSTGRRPPGRCRASRAAPPNSGCSRHACAAVRGFAPPHAAGCG